MQEVETMELALTVLVWVTFVLLLDSNSIMASTEETTTLVDSFVRLVEEWLVLVMVLLAAPLSVILVAVNPHPLNLLREHGSDGISIR